jgi:hypothetical protein
MRHTRSKDHDPNGSWFLHFRRGEQRLFQAAEPGDEAAEADHGKDPARSADDEPRFFSWLYTAGWAIVRADSQRQDPAFCRKYLRADRSG